MEFAEKYLNPMHDHHNEAHIEDVVENAGDGNDWQTMARKLEELETKLAEQFEDNGGADRDDPPVIKAPIGFIQEEWERHPTIHILYAVWRNCKFCVCVITVAVITVNFVCEYYVFVAR